MNTFLRMTLLFALLVLPAQVFAQETDTISVPLAIGIGKDGDAALKNALRVAVEQTVGSMIAAETLVQNDEVVSDKILSFSDGFVQTYKQLGEPKTMDGGLVQVRISAEVKRNDLKERLQSAGVIVAVSGKMLKVEMITKEKSHKDGIEMLEEFLDQYPLHYYNVSAEPRYDVATQKAVIEVIAQIDMKKYAAFRSEFVELLQKMGGKPVGAATQQVTRSEYSGLHVYQVNGTPSPQRGSVTFVIANDYPNFRRAGQGGQINFNFYSLPENVWKMISPFFYKRSVVVEVLDINGRVLAVAKVGTQAYTAATLSGQYSELMGNWSWVHIVPSFSINNRAFSVEGNTFFRNENSATAHSREYAVVGTGTPELKLSVPLNIPKNDIEKIATVRISME